MRVTVCRKAHFNAAHRLYRKDWSFEKNDAVFGKCNNPNFHGHNYELIASVTGDIDPETGYVIDVKILKDLIKSEIEDAFDHRREIRLVHRVVRYMRRDDLAGQRKKFGAIKRFVRLIFGHRFIRLSASIGAFL